MDRTGRSGRKEEAFFLNRKHRVYEIRESCHHGTDQSLVRPHDIDNVCACVFVYFTTVYELHCLYRVGGMTIYGIYIGKDVGGSSLVFLR
jgi:hypothetical protein